MLRKISFEEDLALKRLARTPADKKPRFDWSVVLNDDPSELPLTVFADGQEQPLDFNRIAQIVGSAITNLHLSRSDDSIFTDQNRRFVSQITQEVVRRLSEETAQGRGLKLSQRDLYLLVEKALVEKEAHDVARSLVVTYSQNMQAETPEVADFGSNLEPIHVKVIRRNGQVVPWNPNKIEIAVRKAFLSLSLDSEPAASVASAVGQRIAAQGHSFINMEDLQDLVQEELMRQGHFKVAEAYILYRAHRARIRDEELDSEADSQQNSMIVIKHLDGRTFFWDGVDLKRRIEFALIGLELCLTADEIERELRRSIGAEIFHEDLKRTIILNAKALIERDADFARFAGRILLTYIYEEVLGWDIVQDGVGSLRDFHRRGFRKYLQRGVEIERLDKRLLTLDLDALSDSIDPSADLSFDYLGIQTLYDRYLIVDKKVEPFRRLETPQYFWMRVAMGLFIEQKDSPEVRIRELYYLYKNRRFCSSTPTLFNSGTLHPQLSSCYLYKVDDSIESIMVRGIAENAFLSKWAGGLGGSWSAVRGTGGYIKGTNGESQGVIPFLKLHNDQLVAVNQGGKRRGSGCAYLESWHNDIFDFLELRRNTGDERRRTHDMNTANWIPDLFMKRMEQRKDWTLFRSNEVADLVDLYGKAFETRYEEYEALAEKGEIFGKKVPALDLWKLMLRNLFETGHPWITFKDPCNVRSPQDHCGVIHSSNLCTEITLNTGADETAVCNLGSIILDSHITPDGQLDLDKLRETVRIAVRALDNVIDINFYPTEAARRSNERHRPIGLGVMGLQNALYLRGIPFASDEAVEFNDEFMEAIAYFAYEASSDLAAELGTYSSFKGSKWDRGLLPQDTLDLLEEERGQPIDVPRGGRMDWDSLRVKIQSQGMRNSNVLAIAPTATISHIMGSSPCIEPAFKNIFVRSNLSGDFVVLNGHLVRDLKKQGLWSQEMLDQIKYFDGELDDIPQIPADIKERYKTAFGIPWEYFIRSAARRQKWIDQAQSVNLFLAKPELKTLSHMYRAAWSQGLKTTYYLRSLAASNIEKATVTVKKEVRIKNQDAVAQPTNRVYTEEEKRACSIDAMMNGEACEACQ
jgi:ribonucleoside-diphosphate reductase alpha chain